jgi:hypothetical protein
MYLHLDRLARMEFHKDYLWNRGLLRLRRKYLVSAVMTTRAKSRISHGLLVVRSWLTD